MKYHKIIIRIFIFISLIPLNSKAISLEDAINMAKKNSKEGIIALKKFQQSNLSFTYYKTNNKPFCSLSTTPIQYSTDVIQRYSYSTDRTYFRKQNYLYSSTNLKIKQNVNFLGGYIFVDSDLRFYKSLGENRYKQFTTIPLRIGYSQDLIGYNDFKWQKRKETLAFSLAEKDLLHRLEDITSIVTEKYIDVCLLQEELILAKVNLNNCDTLCIEAEKKLKYGRSSKKDYMNILLERSKANSMYKQTNINLLEAEAILKKYLNYPQDSILNVSMESIINNINHYVEIPISNAIQCALENSSKILEKENNIIDASQNLEEKNIKRYFNAAINASIGLQQISETLKNGYKKPIDEQAISISLSIPLADFGRGRIKYSQAKENLEIQKLQAEKIKEDIREQVRQCVLNHRLKYSLIANAKEIYKLSNMVYDEIIIEHKLGRWNFISLGNAISQRQSAIIEYYRAIKDYFVNYLKICNLTLFDFEKNKNICPPTEILH